MEPTLEQLRTLVTVVDEGTLEAAATRLSLTPSAVSQRLKALEQAVGRTVLVRSKPVGVTETAVGLVRLARQIDLLTADTLAGLEIGTDRQRLSLVINSDSLATWVLPALASAATDGSVLVEVRRADQDRSVELLRDGSAMAAITSVAEPVPGCRVRSLGAMTYRAKANPDFTRRWFPEGATSEALAVAPVVIFDRDDDLQYRWLADHAHGTRLDPPRHYVPESTSYAEAVRHGLGWGLIPDLQSGDGVIDLAPGDCVRVPLYWQQWKLDSPALSRVAAHIADAATRCLDAVVQP